MWLGSRHGTSVLGCVGEMSWLCTLLCPSGRAWVEGGWLWPGVQKKLGMRSVASSLVQ